MTPRPLAAAVLLLLAAIASALDVPVAGRKLVMRASTTPNVKRRMDVVLRDPAIAPPFSNPAAFSVLRVVAGAGFGACRAEIPIFITPWKSIGGDPATNGYVYRNPAAAEFGGIQRIDLKPGRIKITARGVNWPCDLPGPQTTPVIAELRTPGLRWCAAFGGTIRANGLGRFTAKDAPAPAACEKADLTLADLNVLHGVFCPAGTDNCRKTDRIALLYEWVARRGCPDAVALQEVWNNSVSLLQAGAATACPFAYNVVYDPVNTIDDEMILSRWPVLQHEVVKLYKNFRSVLWARIDHPMGPVDVFATHLASGSDGANNPCGADCPPECVAAGAATVRQCQGVQLGTIVAARHDVITPAVVTGDLNQDPTSFVYQHLVGLGWQDSYLGAGNPECAPATGVGCTSGRDDVTLSQLESPASNETERIDYAFVVRTNDPNAICLGPYDPAGDPDGDGTATRLFADLPNPADPMCGPTPHAICWPSDHVGAELDLNCF